MPSEFEGLIQKSQSDEVTASKVPVVTEKQFAQLRWRSIEFRGRYWRGADVAFDLIHMPANQLAILKESEASFPSSRSLGYRARVEGNGRVSNGFLHLHILSDLADFTEHRLKDSARRNIKSAVKNYGVSVAKVEVTNPSLMVEQGYDVLASSLRVNQYAPVPTREKFLETLAVSGDSSEERLILAGMVGDKLGAYVMGVAVDDTAYLEEVVVSEEFKGTNVGSRTIYSFIEACQRTPGVTQVLNWRVQPSDPGLTAYKEKMGFPATRVPVVVKLRPPLETFWGRVVRSLRPGLYFKLYGTY